MCSLAQSQRREELQKKRRGKKEKDRKRCIIENKHLHISASKSDIMISQHPFPFFFGGRKRISKSEGTMMLVTGLVILLIFLTVLVSAVAQEQRVESEVGNLFEQAFVDGRSNKAVATPPDDAKIHTLHSTLMKQIRDVNGTYTATIRTLQVYTEKYRRPDLTLIVEANALTQRLSKLYAELERAWGQYLANCDPKAPNCQAAVGLRQGALQHSRQWSLG